MTAFRVLLVVMFLGITAYTVPVGIADGWNLVPLFFGAIADHNWQGQFNLDFMCMLALSGLWTAWRCRFSLAGIGLGVVALFMGTPFQAIHLLVLMARARGDMVRVLIGADRAAHPAC